MTRIWRRLTLEFFEFVGETDGSRDLRVDRERLDRAKAVNIRRRARRGRKLPAHCVWVEVVPHTPKVEIEYVPTEPAPAVDDDRRCIANISAPVQAISKASATGGIDDVVV